MNPATKRSHELDPTRLRRALVQRRAQHALDTQHEAHAVPANDGVEELAEMGREALALCRAMRDCDLGSWPEELVIARQVALADRLDAFEVVLARAHAALGANEGGE